MFCFLCQVKLQWAPEPPAEKQQESQGRSVAVSHEVSLALLLHHTLGSWYALKYLFIRVAQQQMGAVVSSSQGKGFRYRRPDSAPGSTSCHQPCLSLFVTQRFEFLCKLIWNLLPRRTSAAYYSMLGYQNLFQRLLRSPTSKWCLQQKANFTCL